MRYVRSSTALAQWALVFVLLQNFWLSAAFAAPERAGRAPLAVDSAGQISRALTYLAARQFANGGFEGFTPGAADEFTTIRVVLGLAAADRSVRALTSSGGQTAIDFLAGRAAAYVRNPDGSINPGRAGMLAVAAVAANQDPTSFGGVNLIGEIEAAYVPGSGWYGPAAGPAPGAIAQLWAIMALASAQRPVPTAATTFLLGLREADGGFGFGFGGDVDTTAFALQSLLASGNVSPSDERIQRPIQFLRMTQAASGGWESFGSLSPDSTAAAIQALAALGYTPVTASWATARGRTPRDDLRDLQAADGSFGGNVLGTADAIAGLAERPAPIYARTGRARLALSWLATQQNADGSFNGFSGPDVGATADAVLAYAAAGFDPATVRASTSAPSALDYLAARGPAYAARGPDAAGKLALAIKAAGRDPSSFGGMNLVTVLNGQYDPTTRSFGSDPNNTFQQAFAILGLGAAGATIPPAAVARLASLRQSDGGWKYDLTPAEYNTTSPESTGLALQALVAGGTAPSSATIGSARDFLRARQDALGGWSDPNSTAYAMQGLLAIGEDLARGWLRGGASPYEALGRYAKSDGPFLFSSDYAADNALATMQAIPALLGAPLPILPGRALTAFTPVMRPPDPDRLVTGLARLSVGAAAIEVVIPFGSDVNGDATVTASWRLDGGAAQPVVLVRQDGFYSGTIPSRQAGSRYDLEVTMADPDGLQGASRQSVSAAVPPVRIVFPSVPRLAEIR